MSEQLHLSFYRATACNATHGIAVSEMSVRPSVKRMDCDNTKKKTSCAHILIRFKPHERTSILVFWQQHAMPLSS